MVSIEYCFIFTFFVQSSLSFTSNKEAESDLLFSGEDSQNLVRSRRHTEAFDIYQQPFNPALHKRKRGFLANLKEKIMSFITGRNKRYQRPNIPDEVLEDESTNNLEPSKETDNNIEEATSSTQMEMENNLGNADLVSRLRKMLVHYENTLNNLKKTKPNHKKYKKHNVTLNSHEQNENIERKKRYSEKKELKSRYFHSVNSAQKITTDLPSTYLSIGSHVEDHNPKNYNLLEETKKRDKILKSILRLGSHKKHHKLTKYSKFNSNEKISHQIKTFSNKGAKSFIHENSNEKSNENKKPKYIYAKTCITKNSKENMNNPIGGFKHDALNTDHINSNEYNNINTEEYKQKNLKSSGYIKSNEKIKTQVKVSKHKGDSFSHENIENSI